ncbi:hypothetical protein [Sphingomonas oryzagri]|uniref:YozE SAM-like domain-containing protein n=1 Tax=Sphingomonas oryzagri TaxID=3042314 RepID=A0ABT6MYN6_9SPHN|nr:hypothetical protein [Sphingomonas oryzagri]MDH7638107.1 hypothetical protein [Sphingomonas oryzagri]
MAESFAKWLSSQASYPDRDIATLAAIVADFPEVSEASIYDIRLWLVDRGAGAEAFDAVERAFALWGNVERT